MKDLILTGDYVLLKPLQSDHVDELYAATDPRIWELITYRLDTRDELISFVERALLHKNLEEEYPFVVYNKDTNECVGTTRFKRVPNNFSALEIGMTWFNPSVWGSFVNTESKYVMLQFAFEQLKLSQVYFRVSTKNIRSQKAIEKLHASVEYTFMHKTLSGNEQEMYMYSIPYYQWDILKEELRKKLYFDDEQCYA